MAPTAAQAAGPTVNSCAKSGRYLAEYFKGTSFKGKPVKARCESSINETYRSGARPSGIKVGPHNFSVRWTKLQKFSSASYDFRTKADDTVRVRLDSKTLISQKKYGKYRTAVARVSKGTHRLVVEYTQKTGAGYIRTEIVRSPDRTAPATPRSVVAKAGSERATVTWKANTQLDLAGYFVYRSTSSKVSTSGKPTSGSKPITKTSFTDTGARSPNAYYYAVVAVDQRGNRSKAARSNKVTPQDRTAPRTPRGLKVVSGDSTAALSWSANTESDLRDYRVYRATGTGKAYWIATVSKSKRSFSDSKLTNTKTYVYSLAAVDKAGNISGRSAGVSARPTDKTAPAAPAGLKATSLDGRVRLDWRANTEKDLALYQVFRSTGSGAFARIATVAKPGTTFIDAAVKNGTSYRYAVAAVDTTGNVSKNSSSVSAKPVDTTAPAAPRNLKADASDGTVKLTWSGNTESDLKEYQVFRTTGGSATKIGTTGKSDESFTDSSAENGTTYVYWVVAVDTAGNASGNSNVVAANPADNSAPATPKALKAAAGDGQVVLSWTANSENDLEEYQIFRTVTAGLKGLAVAEPEPLATVPAGTVNYTDTTAKNGTAYSYTIRAVDKAGNASAPSEAALANPADKSAPDAPEGLKAAEVEGSVAVTWNANSESDLSSYVLSRSENNAAPTKIATLKAGTLSFNDEDVVVGSNYVYTLVAVDKTGNTSVPSAPAMVSLSDTTAPDAPQNLIAKAGDAQVTLTWDANTEEDLTEYRVQRDGNQVAVVAAGTETFLDTTAKNGTSYSYRVVAVDTAGNVSDESNADTAEPSDKTAPDAPKNLEATAAEGKINLSWDANSEEDLKEYEVYRSVDSATSTKITTIAAGTTTYTDSDVVNGTSYTYMIKAVDKAGNSSAPSNTATAGPKDTNAPAVPMSLAATAGDARVTLTWDANTEEDLQGYQLFRATDTEEATKLVDVPKGTETYLDATAKNGTAYQYHLVAVDLAGNLSSATAAVTATPADTTAPAAPTGLEAVAGDATVELTWDLNTEVDLEGYRVLRSNGTGESAEIASTLEPTYVDDSVTNGTTYRYQVIAVDGAKNASAPSAVVEATPKAAPVEPVNTKISFTTTADAAVPAGYAKNDGAAWTDTTGLGWVTEASLSTDTHVPMDLRLNTRIRIQPGVSALQNRLIHLQYGTSTDPDSTKGVLASGAFEIATADGWYAVTASVGDQVGGSGYDSQHTINAEGTAVIDRFQGTLAKEFSAATKVVEVTDGRLTIDAIGGKNTKLNYLEVKPTDEPIEPVMSQKINFADEATAPPAGYLADFGQAYGARARADQGTDLTYGWVALEGGLPIDFSKNGRNRITDKQAPAGTDPRLATFIHMQAPANAASGNKTPGSWELAVPNGSYNVSVTVGEAGTAVDSVHWISIENQNAIAGYLPTGAAGSAGHHTTASRTVTVSDGRLTLSPERGTNTKIDYVTIDSIAGATAQPAVLKSTPGNLATDVSLTGSVVADLTLRGGGVDPASLTADTAKLIKVSDDSQVEANTITSGGADVINVSPEESLEPNTTYRFVVTDGVKDVDGKGFLPYSSVFTTGDGGSTGGPMAFTKSDSGAASVGGGYTSLVKGPDGKMYAGSIMGDIYRFDIAADGKLTNRKEISTVRTYSESAASGDTYNKGTRTVIGMAFDPKSTASEPILWISDNAPFLGASDVPDFSGRIAKLTGPDLGTYTAVVDGLPRSIKDHESNSVAFGPDGALYLNQGANNAMGAPDNAWGNRSETVLSAAVLRLDPSKVGDETVNVRTNNAGNYNPFEADAPLTIYASGTRNAFDLLWHSNGHLYVPTNGSAAGGNVPAVPADPMPNECKTRPDGGYTGPKVAAQNNNPEETDYVFDVRKDKYYGHPNPARCEYVLNAGNPTAGKDAFENSKYPVGTLADPNYDATNVYDAGLHASANGVIEYQGNAFGGAMKGKLIYVRYSSGQDLVTFDVAANGKLSNRTTGITGFTGFNQPLDVGQDPATGNLYVSQLGNSTIALVKPQGGSDSAVAQVTERLVFSGQNNVTSPGLNVVVKNIGSQPLTIPASGVNLTGDNANQFVLGGTTLPATIATNASLNLPVTFKPTSSGVKAAGLTINTNAGNKTTVLRGLATPGVSGGNEPSLQRIFDTYQLGIQSGDPNPNDSGMPDTQGPIGDEVTSPVFVKAAFDKPISITPIAAYAPQETEPAIKVGWYEAGKASAVHEQFSVRKAEAQSLMINATGKTEDIDPGEETQFGFYSEYPSFANRRVFTEPALNTWDTAKPHKVRVYPLKDADGVVEPNAFVLATEEIPGSFDNQDIVLIVRNVKPYVQTTVPGAELAAVNPDASPFADQIAFNRIQTPVDATQKVADTGKVKITNTGTKPMQVTGLPITGQFELVDAPTLPLNLAAGASTTVTVKFVAQSIKVHTGTLTVQSNAEKNPTQVIHLGGLWQSVSEGGQEPGMAQVAKAFGSGTTIPANLNGKGKVEKVGDEVLSPYWKRLDGTKQVTVKQLAGYHTFPNKATVFRHNKGNNTTAEIATMDGLWAQSLLPHKQGANTQLTTGSFTPGSDAFGFNLDGEWSDPTKNNSAVDEANGCVAPCGQHVRFFPVEDRTGVAVPGSYFMIMDYSGINYDYQDNIYLVENIRPEVLATPEGLVAVPGNDQVTLSWSPTTDGTGYRIWRGTSPSVTATGTPVSGTAALTEPHFTDTTAKNGTTYYYVLQSVIPGSANSESTPVVSATPTASPAAVSTKIDFGNEAAPLGGTGYLKDFGQPFGSRSRSDQGTGLTFGWVGETDSNPLNLSVGGTTGPGNGRERKLQADKRLDTILHMQADDVPNFNGTPLPGKWEMAVPNGKYDVTVAVGDPTQNTDPEIHTINAEGTNVIKDFVPTGAAGSITHHKIATVEVTVTDGRLTIDALGGTNTKIGYVDIESVN